MRTRDARLARRATEIALSGRAFEQALASAQLWSELDPASTESQQTLETLQLATGKLQDVEPALARRLATAREQGKLDENYLQLQRTLTRIQDRKEGWAMLQRISAPDLKVVSARMARASVAAAADQKEAAAAEATAALELAPKDSMAAIAAAQYTQDLPDGGPRAAALLKDFLRRSPDNQDVRLALGRLYLADNKLADAGKTLEAALAKDPQNPQVLYSLAQASYQAKDPAKAEDYLKRYVALPEDVPRENPPAYLFLSQIADAQIIDSLGWVYYRMGDMPNALKYLREAYSAKPDVEVAAHFGEVLWTTGAREEALKVWREASGREPKNEVLRGTLARLNVSL